ncbi:MAG: hypothetical protein HYX75_19540 [Acidobacteria bacterium]|nr:hypothetical protein [Acidobacteriota bacterium]
MDFLLLYIGEGMRFDREEVKRVFRELPGVRNFEERAGVGWWLQAHLDEGNDSTIIRLVTDEESISVSGSGDASLKAAVAIQAGMKVSLRVVDVDYSFDLPLRDLRSTEDLRKAIVQARKGNQKDGVT